MKESWLGSVGHLLPRLHGQTYKTPVSPYRGLFSGEQVWLGSDVCMTTERVASYPGPFEKSEKRAWYPLFAHALNFPTFREFRIIP